MWAKGKNMLTCGHFPNALNIKFTQFVELAIHTGKQDEMKIHFILFNLREEKIQVA